jgi:Protein of unknown function (DUF3349)
MRNPVPCIIGWLRAGYPDVAPRTGYSPLIALNGPSTLSHKQTREVVRELGGNPRNSTDIAVASTRMPVAARSAALRCAGWPDESRAYSATVDGESWSPCLRDTGIRRRNASDT